MRIREIVNRDLLATCWTWAGATDPARGREVSPVDIDERIAAVSAAGWKGVGFVHGDVMHVLRTIGADGLSRRLRDHGIEHVELEFIPNWWADGAARRASDTVRAELFHAAAELGATTIKVGGVIEVFRSGTPVTRERFAASFDALATDAGRHGVRIALEPMPMSNVPTVIEGAQLVRELANPHAGLAVDSWHVGRSAIAHDSLAEILPMEHVFLVELADADAEVIGSLWEDTLDNRRMPGDGALELASFVAALHDAGWRGHWGVEILSSELRGLPVADVVRTAHDKTLAVLDAAEHVACSAGGGSA